MRALARAAGLLLAAPWLFEAAREATATLGPWAPLAALAAWRALVAAAEGVVRALAPRVATRTPQGQTTRS